MPGSNINILGISAYYHDTAASLVRDGEIIAAAQEERFSRKKHDERFPANAIDYCLREGGITTADLDYVAFYEKPFVKFDRLDFASKFLLQFGVRDLNHGRPTMRTAIGQVAGQQIAN